MIATWSRTKLITTCLCAMSFLDLFKIQQGFNAFDLHVQKIHVFTDHVPEVEQNKQ